MNPLSPIDARGGRRRLTPRWIFTLFTIGCVFVTSLYVINVSRRERISTTPNDTRDASTYSIDTRPWPTAGPTVLFSSVIPNDDMRHRVAVVPLQAPDGPRWLTGLVCERLYFAGARGICLGSGGGTAIQKDAIPSTHAYIFGTDLQIRHDIALGGLPSRVRVSPDGRYGAVTVFVAGHSYADAGFSTETTLIDLERGVKIGSLEGFPVTRNGGRFRRVDFNFWGVTFAPDSDRFYATLATGGTTYLVQGSVRDRRVETRRENVECPSLSPDGTRLVFKKRLASGVGSPWRFHVLDLATMVETPLAERRSLDDQVEWLDDHRILYEDPVNVWTVPADGTGQPMKFLSQANSPIVLRTAWPASATVRGTNPLPGGNSVALHGADLAIAVTTDSRQVPIGGQISYTVNVTNHGPHDATDVRVDQFPGDTLSPIGIPAATNPGSGYGCSLHEEGHLSCDTPRLSKGVTWTISFNVRATAAGMPTTRVVVAAAEPDPRNDNDSAESRTTVQPTVTPQER